uniref:Chemokine interleukin-8-like domain-containing protein n=1 Tax=Esox lucius TaxID=8010 RepID=A0A3P8ZCZ8_ESOLU
MDLRLMVLLLFLCALAITTTEGGIPKCCVKISKDFPPNLLMKVEKVDVQKNNGACEINALIAREREEILCPPQGKKKAEEDPEKKGWKKEEALELCGGREQLDVWQITCGQTTTILNDFKFWDNQV